MKTKIVSLLLAVITLAVLSGCASLMSDAATRLQVETPSGLKVSYQSPKDQRLEYNPETGAILVESRTNAELAAQAAAAQAEANRATADVLKSVVERIPVNPANTLNPIN